MNYFVRAQIHFVTLVTNSEGHSNSMPSKGKFWRFGFSSGEKRAGAKALTLLIAGVPGFAFASRLIHALANE